MTRTVKKRDRPKRTGRKALQPVLNIDEKAGLMDPSGVVKYHGLGFKKLRDCMRSKILFFIFWAIVSNAGWASYFLKATTIKEYSERPFADRPGHDSRVGNTCTGLERKLNPA